MQNSNLSSKIMPSIKDDWNLFLERVNNELKEMIDLLNNDLRRIKELDKIISKINEIIKISKDNMENILNYRDLFTYVDKNLDSSFEALLFFKEKNNFDNVAVEMIYNQIVNSKKIVEMTNEYRNLSIKNQFLRERIKSIQGLLSGKSIDFSLINELIEKYKFKDTTKKNILFYPFIMLAIRQKEIKKDKEEDKESIKEEKALEFKKKFDELCQNYQDVKENSKAILIKAFNTRKNMRYEEIDMYNSFINDSFTSLKESFDDIALFKIYSLALFKIKKDIENLIASINDLSMDDVSELDDELEFLKESINEFEEITKILLQIDKDNVEVLDNNQEHKTFFALDAFNRLIVDRDLIVNNKSNIVALIQKINSSYKGKIDGAKTNHMLGVSDLERLLEKNISMVTMTKIMLAYITVGNHILIITGTNVESDRFNKEVAMTISRNITAIKKQIALIEKNDFSYTELQNELMKNIFNEIEIIDDSGKHL